MHEAAQRAEFDLLVESQFWSAERLRALQRERLEKLLRHARAHVPFYATRLDMLFRADGSIDWDRWGEVPTLKRADLVEHRRAMLARMMPEGHGPIGDMSTSGSTGRPVTTSHSRLSIQMSQAAVYRANVNDGIDFGAPLGLWTGQPDTSPWPEGRRVGRWGPAWDKRAADGEAFEISHTVRVAQVLEFMGRHSVRYVVMGGGDARLLALEARRLGVTLALDAIFTRGSDPGPAGAQAVAEVFGARTLPLYSSKEGHRMAHRCPGCGNWHVNDEQIRIEILDDQDRPVAVGQSGRVVITPFWSYAQPLIRYEQGDFATRGAPGDCGKGLSVMSAIVGRVPHLFVMPDGSRIKPTLNTPAISALNAAMFQVAQVSREAIEVRYVPLDNGRTAEIGPALADLAAQLHPGVTVTFREVPAFDLPPGRKHIEFLSELPNRPD